MITKISLRNIKGFDSVEIPLSSFNLFSGTNGVGKSTIIQSLLIRSARSEIVEQHDLVTGVQQFRIPLDLGYINLGRAGDVIRRNRTTNEISIEHFDDASSIKLNIVESKEDDFLTVISGRRELPRLKLQYLNAERIGPRTTYLGKTIAQREEGRNNFLGAFGELTSSYLAARPARAINQELLHVEPRVDSYGSLMPYSFIEGINIWLDRIKKGAKVASKNDGETNQSIIRFNSNVRPVNEGFGLSVVLPIVVLILAAPPGSLIIIENPEAHLHPAGQYYIGQLLCLASRAGHQLIIETHSDHILNSVRLSVKDHLLSPDKISLLHFYKDAGADDVSKFHQIGIDSTGVLRDSPEGFFDEYTKRLRELW